MSLLPSCDRMVFSEDILKWESKTQNTRRFQGKKLNRSFPCPSNSITVSDARDQSKDLGNTVLSSRTEQGDNAGNWKERKDRVQLFFSSMCNKRKILFCLTVHIKALILLFYFYFFTVEIFGITQNRKLHFMEFIIFSSHLVQIHLFFPHKRL